MTISDQQERRKTKRKKVKEMTSTGNPVGSYTVVEGVEYVENVDVSVVVLHHDGFMMKHCFTARKSDA